MNINYDIIIAKNFNTLITEEEYEKAIENGIFERDYMLRRIKDSVYASEYLIDRAYAAPYVNAKYQNMSLAEKAIMAGTIAFDNKKFASVLLKGNFNYESLVTFLKLVDYLKFKKNNQVMDEKNKKYENSVNLYARKLENHFRYHFGRTNINIIINKINEIISYEPELLLDNNKNKMR